MGCLRNLYFNHNNVIEQLSDGYQGARYHGSKLRYGCESISQVVMSFITNTSQLHLPVESRHYIRVRLDFRSLSQNGLLLYAQLKSLNYYQGFVEVRAMNFSVD